MTPAGAAAGAPPFVEQRLSGWGRFPVESCAVYRPERRRELAEVFRAGAHRSYVSRGMGRAYGDAALNAGSGVVSHLRLNRLLAFDEATGVLECEAGATVGEIVDALLPRGFFPLVTPGTRHVTVGGAIANDVHGKNHPRDGSFSASIDSLTLVVPSGEELVCSRSERPDVFWATVGGLGLTGAIASARIRLRRVSSRAMRVDTDRFSALEPLLEALDRAAADAEYAMAWVDALAPGAARGRGVVFAGRHADGPGETKARDGAVRIPFVLPGWALRPAGVRAFNRLYLARHPRHRNEVVDARRFFYPLDEIGEWNRAYGRRGFVQYQAAIPAARSADAFAALLETAVRAGHPPFLCVAKRFGPGGEGLLSFPREGFTLAMDIAARPGIRELARALDTIVLEAGGRVYLGKDALLGPEAFREMYPRADEFMAVKRRLDPDGRLSSSLARRVGLAPG